MKIFNRFTGKLIVEWDMKVSLARANLAYANLAGANLTDANLDFSCWPLWCGSIGVAPPRQTVAQVGRLRDRDAGGEQVRAWWFEDGSHKLPNNDGREVKQGVTHKHTGPLVLCNSGLHASAKLSDALKYAPGNYLWLVECGGEIVKGDDKIVCSERTYIKGIDAESILREHARWCALQVIHLWDAPEVVVRYLTTGDESIREAANASARASARYAESATASATANASASAVVWYAARAAESASARVATSDAARASAWDSAWYAWDAARAAQNKHLTRLVNKAMKA